MTELSPIQAGYYATVISLSESPTLMAVIYEIVTGEDLPSCRWWARHDWKRTSEQGSVVTGQTTGRGFFCRHCRRGFSVGSLGYQTWRNDG